MEDLHEGCLGAGSPLGSTGPQGTPHDLNVLEVHDQVLRPLGSPLSHGDGLGGLEMGEAQSGHILVLVGKLSEVADDLGKLGEDQV